MMTRTNCRFIVGLPFALCLMALVATGCGPNAQEQKISELTAEVDDMQRDLDERDRQLNEALVREEDARTSIDDLNQQLAGLRAEGKKIKESGGWISMPGFDMISVPGSVLFASGKSTLTSKGRGALSKIAADIRERFADREIYVFGHTDDRPIRKSKWKDNWELGAHRALTVVRNLRDNGISEQRLVQASCSQYRPKTSNDSEAKRRQNRRVEFYAVKRTGGATRATAARFRDD
ncbi:MAG: OmpA family protein [Phycisphaerae bacterium]